MEMAIMTTASNGSARIERLTTGSHGSKDTR